MSTEYRYMPLSSLSDDTIRLLELYPGQPHQKITCELSTAQLTLRPKFAALSYVWGTDPASEEIELNGKQFWIRKNLWQCLIRLRELTRPLIIWIDAICVNQKDVLERNQQVGFMNHIFSTAKPVFAWLGEDVGQVCESLQEELLDFLQFATNTEEISLQVANKTYLEKLVRLYHSVATLCESQYWSRVWIVQEVLVAQKLLLCIHEQRVAWEDFRFCCKSLLGDSERAGALCDDPRAVEAFKYCRSALLGGGMKNFIFLPNSEIIGGRSTSRPPSLHRLISIYGLQKCSDPRDRVYALLGLRKYRYVHRLRDRPPLQADYGKSTADLFFDVILFEGLPDASFPSFLYHVLNLKMDELERVSRLRTEDIFQSHMKLEAKVQDVLFSKLEGLSHSGDFYYSQFVLTEPEKESATSSPSSEGEDAFLPEYMLAFATGNCTVRAGDFIFRLQHSSILFAFRYERSYFRPIARVQRLMPEHDKIAYQKHGSALCNHGAPRMPLEKIYAPMIDFEIWSGLQEFEFGPDLLLEIMKHMRVYDENFNFDDWS